MYYIIVFMYVFICSMPERESFGIRFFASNRTISIRRKMKSTLSTTRKQLQSTIAELEGGGGGGGERTDQLRTFLPQLLKYVNLSLFVSLSLSLSLSLSQGSGAIFC